MFQEMLLYQQHRRKPILQKDQPQKVAEHAKKETHQNMIYRKVFVPFVPFCCEKENNTSSATKSRRRRKKTTHDLCFKERKILTQRISEMPPYTRISRHYTVNDWIELSQLLMLNSTDSSAWEKAFDIFETRIRTRFLDPIKKICAGNYKRIWWR